MAKKQDSASGLDTNQLAVMRMLLAQQQPVQYQTPPIQDIGSGINAAAGHIAHAIEQRHSQQQQMQMYQMMLAQSQAQHEQEIAQQAQQAQVLGVDPSVLGLDPSVQNTVIKEQNDQANLARTAQTLQALPQFQHPYLKNLVEADPYQRDAQGNQMMGSSLEQSQAMALARSPEAVKEMLIQGYAHPYGASIANSITGPIDTSTPAGFNYFQQANHFAPQTPADTLKQASDANMSSLDYRIKNKQAPDLVAQPGLANQQTVAQTQGTNLSNDHQSMVNAATPDLLQNQVTSGDLNLSQQTGRLDLLNHALSSGDYYDPTKGPGILAQIQAMGGPNLQQNWDIPGQLYGTGKDHNPNLKRLDQYSASLPSNQPTAQAPPSQPAPSFQLFDQGALNQLNPSSSPESVNQARSQFFAPAGMAFNNANQGIQNYLTNSSAQDARWRTLLGLPQNPFYNLMHR